MLTLPTTRRTWQPWTATQDAYLIDCRKQGKTLLQIAHQLGRPYGSVVERCRELGHGGRKKRPCPLDDGGLILLAARANELCWDAETLAALLVGKGFPDGWREELISLAARVNVMYAELVAARDRELER